MKHIIKCWQYKPGDLVICRRGGKQKIALILKKYGTVRKRGFIPSTDYHVLLDGMTVFKLIFGSSEITCGDATNSKI